MTKSLGATDTVLCTTMMGPTTLREFVSAASSAGFTAISLSGADYKQAKSEGLSDADIRTMLSDNDIRVAEIDGIIDWLFPMPSSQGAGFELDHPFFQHTESELLAIGEAVGARSITACDPFDRAASPDQIAEAFARLCDRAADHGLLVHLEYISWGPVLGLAAGWETVRQADRPNGGLAIDVLHTFRSNTQDALKSIPGEKIFATQFCDGFNDESRDLFDEASNRQWLGDGDFDVVGILQTLDAISSNAPIGIEVPSDANRAKTPAAIADDAYRSLRDFLDKTRSSF